MRRYINDAPRARALEDALAGIEGPDDVCLVLGGDGTMLRAIQQFGTGFTYLGINCGHLGFLMNDVPMETAAAEGVVRRMVEEGAWAAHEFPRLRAWVEPGGREAWALNDVYVEREGQTCHLRVTVDGVEVVDKMVADGVIAATPLGSTAYSFSAGGPAGHPRLHALHLTPICPHRPRLAPLILPANALVRIEVLDPEERPARAVADGVALPHVTTVEVSTDPEPVRIAFARHHDFTATMIRKILHP